MAQPLKVEEAVSSVTTTGSYRWIVCALLFFATTINYMDRQILSLLKPILDNQLHWTNEEFGAINGAFQGAYAIGALLQCSDALTPYPVSVPSSSITAVFLSPSLNSRLTLTRSV